MKIDLGDYQTAVTEAITNLHTNKVIERIWAHDHTVWKSEPDEISNRLGWLHMPDVMPDYVGQIDELVQAVREDGFTTAVVLGMGGSSLAPEVFAKTFAASSDGLDLWVLDSTDPDRVLSYVDMLNLTKTLFIVATKSGSTVETLSFFKFFYNSVLKAVGGSKVGQHFVAITDPGSKLETLASTYNFREIFLNDPNIGGRYSALSHFGLVPAALVGVDVPTLLERALDMATNNALTTADNEAVQLGVILGELAKAGRDKVTFLTSAAVASFGDWVEQLIAESTGKQGVGILPVVGEAVGPVDGYGHDRLFIILSLAEDASLAQTAASLAAAGQPTVTIALQDVYDLGGQYFLWEMATAIAGHILGIHPFNQPNVESAKVLAKQMVSEYMEKGTLPESESAPVTGEALRDFLAQAKKGDYVALQAYLHPTDAAETVLQALRLYIRDTYQLATTLGYGPRFLHSTGQLHKGDGGNGLFVQFTIEAREDVEIPDEAGQADSTMSFGVLKMAQALGDAQALRDADRRVIRFHLTNGIEDIQRITE